MKPAPENRPIAASRERWRKKMTQPALRVHGVPNETVFRQRNTADIASSRYSTNQWRDSYPIPLEYFPVDKIESPNFYSPYIALLHDWQLSFQSYITSSNAQRNITL